MTTTTSLWNRITLGQIRLEHRLAMAPMTRSRSTQGGVPTELNPAYYAQRASTALIITEGTQPSDDGQGYLLMPGIYTDKHIVGWQRVTDAVHEAGGRIVIQLMHVGRISHPSNAPHGRQSVAPSVVKPANQMFTASGIREMPEPRALSEQESADMVQAFRRADGVEIHGANGYLVQQFLSSNANQRTDQYGGSVENRIRFAVEVASAVAEEIGPGRTGIRISPGNPFNDIVEDDVAEVYAELYGALVRALAPLELAYLHVAHSGNEELLSAIRRDWPGALLLNRGGADLETRAEDVENGFANVITVGSMVLANPDLVARIKSNAPLNEPDKSTFYGDDARGYTDYPALPLTAPVGVGDD